MNANIDSEIPAFFHLNKTRDPPRRHSVSFDLRHNTTILQKDVNLTRASTSHLQNKYRRFSRGSDVSNYSIPPSRLKRKKWSKLNLVFIRIIVLLVFIGFGVFFYKYYVYLRKLNKIWIYSILPKDIFIIGGTITSYYFPLWF